MIRRLVRCLVFSLALVFLTAQSGEYPRTMYVSYDHAPVYDSASYMSAVVGDLKLGDSVTVVGGDKRYFRVRLADREGYVLWSNLSLKKIAGKKGAGTKETGKKEGGRKKEAAPDTSARAAAPIDTGRNESRTSERAAKAGRQEERPQCAATTKSGKRCSRRVADSSEFCWQHRKSK